MRHEATEMKFEGRAGRVGRNGKRYWVIVMRCPVCSRATHALANASRGKKAAPCTGR
jgi:hypothetical protein